MLLTSDKAAANFSDRSLLKNLGHWLGMITLAKNKPILHTVSFQSFQLAGRNVVIITGLLQDFDHVRILNSMSNKPVRYACLYPLFLRQGSDNVLMGF